MIADLIGLPAEAATLIRGVVFAVIAIISTIVVVQVCVTGRPEADRLLEARLLAFLDGHAHEYPALVAEARDLHGHLTTQAWALHVRALANHADLTEQARADLAAALTFRPEHPAGATA